MRVGVVLGLLLVGVAWQVAAQQVEPKEPAIVLPPVLQKVEDVSQANIDTPLPPDSAPTLPQISVALPEAQNIKVSGATSALTPPAQAAAGGAIASGTQPQSTFFSDGMIGAGSMNEMIGDITLYKVGANPRFSLEFSHQRLDGYLGNESSNVLPYYPAGKGFFYQVDALKGSLSYGSSGPFGFTTTDSYRETQDGLQQLGSGSFGSVTHRFLSGSFGGSYAASSRFSIGTSLDATYSDMTLAGSQPQTSTEAHLHPTLDLGLSFSKVKFGLKTYYGLTQTTGQTGYQVQDGGSLLSLSASLPYSLTFDGSVGLDLDQRIGLHVPFSAAIEGVYSDVLSYKLYGGYRIDRFDYFKLWDSYHFLNQGRELQASPDWYGGVSSQLRLGRGFAIGAGIDYSQASAAVIPSSFVASQQLFGFTQAATQTVGPSVNLSWSPAGPFSLNLGWKGAFLNPGAFAPVSTFSLDAELNAASGRYGGSLSGVADLYNIAQQPQLLSAELPNLTLSGYLRVTRGVLFRLSLDDILSPLLVGGRKLWNTYTEPGFRVVARTQISL